MQRPGLSARALGILVATAAALGVVVATGTESSAAQSAARAAVPSAPRSSVVTWGSSAYPAGDRAQDLTYRFVVRTSVGGTGPAHPAVQRLRRPAGDLRARLRGRPRGRRRARARQQQAADLPRRAVGHRPGRRRRATAIRCPAPSGPSPTWRSACTYAARAARATGHRMALQTSYSTGGRPHRRGGAAAYTADRRSWSYLDARQPCGRARRGRRGRPRRLDHRRLGVHRRPQPPLARLPRPAAARPPPPACQGRRQRGDRRQQGPADAAGQSALNRLARDVLSQPGVRTVILLEGVNDIKVEPGATPPS